jgi:hypothetical protein
MPYQIFDLDLYEKKTLSPMVGRAGQEKKADLD